jgi:hypothetical protein
VAVSVSVLPIAVASYQPHRFHGNDRTWAETNCYIDVWVEVLSALGLDPTAAGACTLSADFEGSQWTFLKYPLEDLRYLYGIEVGEMNVWRPLLDHLTEELGAGRLLTVEVDSWWLPDTAGTAYHAQHVKTTIVPQLLDIAGRRLGYFHGAGYHELAGEDFDGVFRLTALPGDFSLPPYVELIRFDRRVSDKDFLDRAVTLAHAHLDRRPLDNPVARLAKRLQADLPWLSEQDLDTFHLYAFGLVRQCGATAELAADFVDWLTSAQVADLGGSAEHFRAVATGAKTVQFQLARLARGRVVDIESTLESLVDNWAAAMDEVVAWHEL